MLKNIMITGATGFIGGHVTRLLVSEGYNVSILVRPESSLLDLNDVAEKLNVCSMGKKSVYDFLKENNTDAVVHIAAYYAKDDSANNIRTMIESNITFPTDMLDSMKSLNIKYFINTGTFFEYGQQDDIITEDTPLNAFNFYSATKIAFLKILEYYCQEGIKAIDLKIFSPYGPFQRKKIIYHVAKSLAQGNTIEITPGEQILDWTYVKDIANAYLLSLKRIEDMKSSIESINIGTGKPVKLSEVVRMLIDISGDNKGLIKMTRGYPEREVMKAICDITKAGDLIGWAPQTSLNEGLADTYNWILNEGQ